MGWVDLIPRAGGQLYIGGLQALYQPNLMLDAKITHVLSVIDYHLYTLQSSANFLKAQNYKHLMIYIEDDPNENLLQHFDEMAKFIDSGLQGGGGVFVHCAMGKSRSAAACVAFLMWKFGVGRDEALARVCEGRAVCEPNLGFMEQLGVYGRMLRVEDGAVRRKVYEDWVAGRFQGASYEWEARALKSKL
jgi:dual specificity phosphatase 12